MEMSMVTLRELGYKKIGQHFLDEEFSHRLGLVALALSGMKMSPYKMLSFWDTIKDSKDESINAMLEWCIFTNNNLKDNDKIEITDKNKFKHAYTQLITKFCEANRITDEIDTRLLIEVGLCLPFALAFLHNSEDEKLRKLVKAINHDRVSDINKINKLYETMYRWAMATTTQSFEDNKITSYNILERLVLLSNEEFCTNLLEERLWG